MRQPLAFAQNVVEYNILPTQVAYGVGLALIPLEVFLAIAFLTGWLTNIAVPLATAMLAVFFIAAGINLKRGRKVSCGCFGDTEEQISPRTLVRLLLLLTAILLLFAFKNMRNASFPILAEIATGALTLINLLLTAFFAAFLILLGAWILNLPELTFLVRYGLQNPLVSGDADERNEAEVA